MVVVYAMNAAVKTSLPYVGGITMLINEASKMTGLTKKAIEYYVLQDLISPSVMENGYRNFSQDDVEALKKIYVLRKLGTGTEDIKAILSDASKSALQNLSVRQELSLQREHAKKSILNQLIQGQSYSDIMEELQAIERSKTITERLLEAFPGYFGRFTCLHFARFLNEPIKTKSQQTAYEQMLSFLDNMPTLILPEELKNYVNENTEHFTTQQIIEMVTSTKKSIENPDEFLLHHKAGIEWYLEYKQSEEYKTTPAYKLMEFMKVFYSASGYYEVFLPALRQVSSSYAAYMEQIEIADKKLLEQYPEIKKYYQDQKS